jgi:hypothetical protein
VEWAEIAKHLAATGKLDYISCSQGTYLNRMMIYPTSPEEHGFQMAATRQVKASIDLPVVGVGRITTPDEAEAILRAGDCDFVGMTRALIADAFWVRKAEQGHADKIRPCVGANWCMESIFAHAPIACIHNPSVGREKQLSEEKVTPADKPRNIAVVGAGPAGLRAGLRAIGWARAQAGGRSRCLPAERCRCPRAARASAAARLGWFERWRRGLADPNHRCKPGCDRSLRD